MRKRKRWAHHNRPVVRGTRADPQQFRGLLDPRQGISTDSCAVDGLAGDGFI